jgi:hypothetical protein
MQIILLIVIEVAIRIAIRRAVQLADEANAELPDGLPNWVYSIVPTGDECRAALLPAEAVAMTVSIVLILIYIPR